MPDLRSFLHETFQKAGGWLPFDQYMAMALYDPHFGYYTSGIEDVGGVRGDFATSATLSGGLGKAVANWLREEAEYHDWTSSIPIIEVGAGNGELAATILKSLGWWGRRKFEYHIVDVSEPLRERQKLRLKASAVTWHPSIHEALETTEGRGLVFSNELVDAFPAKWLRWIEMEECWLEVGVKFDREKGIGEILNPLPNGFPEHDFSAMAMRELPAGQRIEIQPLYRSWLINFAESWQTGSLLTIDYGGRPEEIYRRRPEGTLRGYFRQERIEGPGIYQRFGKQDLTLDVNFLDLIRWGEELGFEMVLEESQAEFLNRWGESADPMAKSGAGEAFRVLHQRRD
ncbi:MAG: SAM-dependent methyltransferase [Verrucomicrobiota bacterium]